MKKYKFSRLDVEITRKCNRRCAHCMRGEAQDLTITEKVIDIKAKFDNANKKPAERQT